MHGEGFLQPFFQAAGRTGIGQFQLPEDLTQFRFGFRNRSSGRRWVTESAASPWALFAVFHIPPLVNLAALYVGPLAEHPLDPRTQSLGPVDHEQVASVWI